jgi:hypothetical protein
MRPDPLVPARASGQAKSPAQQGSPEGRAAERTEMPWWNRMLPFTWWM